MMAGPAFALGTLLAFFVTLVTLLRRFSPLLQKSKNL